MKVRYRNGTIADADAIAALYAQSFTDTFAHLYDPRDLAEHLGTTGAENFTAELGDAQYRFRVAEAGGMVVGFIKLGPPELPIDAPPGTVELRQLYVLRPWQGLGIAAALTDWAIETSRSKGAEHVQLTVYIDNHRARRFYDRYGFEAVGRYDFMVGSHADEDIVMRKVL